MSRLSHKSLFAVGVSRGESGHIAIWELVDSSLSIRANTSSSITPSMGSRRLIEASRTAAASKITTFFILTLAGLCYFLGQIQLKGTQSLGGKGGASWSTQESVLQDFLSSLNV
jgi:hypothetical protein